MVLGLQPPNTTEYCCVYVLYNVVVAFKLFAINGRQGGGCLGRVIIDIITHAIVRNKKVHTQNKRLSIHF